MGTVVLVTGGARSGKSLFAEALAAGLGSYVTYVATAEVSGKQVVAQQGAWASSTKGHNRRYARLAHTALRCPT